MRNILKGFLEPKAEAYVLPSADELHFEGEEEFLPLVEEEPEVEQPLDAAGDNGEAEEPSEPKKPEEPKRETPVHYAQLQAELILNQAREEAEQILRQAREQALAEQEEIRAGARDEGNRDGYAQGTAKAMDDAIRDRDATAARLEKDVQAFL